MPVKITPTPVQEASGINYASFAPVTIKPNIASAISEQIQPSVRRYLRSEAKLKRNTIGGQETYLQISTARQKAVEELEKTEGGVTPQALDTIYRKSIQEMNSKMLMGGVKPSDIKTYQSMLELEKDPGKSFVTLKKGGKVFTTDPYGNTTTKVIDFEDYQEEMLVEALTGLPKSTQVWLATLSPKESEKELAKIITTNATREAHARNIGIKEDYINKAKVDKEKSQIVFEGEWGDLIQNTYNAMRNNSMHILKSVKSGQISPDEGVAALEEMRDLAIYNKENASMLNTLGHTNEELIDATNGLITDMEGLIQASDPQKKLTRRTLFKQKLLEENNADFMLNLPKGVKNQLFILSKLEKAFFSGMTLKAIGDMTGGMGMMNLMFSSDRDINSFGEKWEKFSASNLKDNVNKDMVVTDMAQHLGSAMINFNKDYSLSNNPVVLVENIISAYSMMKENPNYEFVSKQSKYDLERLYKEMYQKMENSDKFTPEVKKLFEESIEETKKGLAVFGFKIY